MIIIGITGSMGMGKTTFSNFFLKKNIPVFDADQEVNNIYKEDILYYKLKKIIHLQDHQCNKEYIKDYLKYNPHFLKNLEKIIHPIILYKMTNFIKKYRYLRKKIVILDIPLLFELKWNRYCNYIITVSCSKFIQKKRLLNRGYSNSKINFLLSKQLYNKKKINKSDFVVYTGNGIYYNSKMGNKILKLCQKN